MNSSAKQRIIGAFVLFALALIFFPLLFDLSGENQIDTTPQIPPMPEIEEVTIPEPQRPENITPPKSFEEAFQPPIDPEEAESLQPTVDPEEAVNLQPEPPSLNEEGLPNAWVIQVASFREPEKATQLEKTLQADGFKSYQQSVQIKNTTVYRVFVGPKVLKQTALEEKQKIDSKYQLESLLLKFSP